MNNKSIYISNALAAICLICLLMSCTKDKPFETYRAYYIPFDIHFYGAVQEDRIEKMSLYIFELTSWNIDELYIAVLSNTTATGKADDILDLRTKLVRLRDGKIVYIDLNRNVISDGCLYAVDNKTVNAVIDDVISKSRDSECLYEDKYLCGGQ